jgi:hypothetical protein
MHAPFALPDPLFGQLKKIQPKAQQETETGSQVVPNPVPIDFQICRLMLDFKQALSKCLVYLNPSARWNIPTSSP